MNLFLFVAAALTRRDPRELLGLKNQVSEAIADTRGYSSRQELIDLKNEIMEVLDDLATGEAWVWIQKVKDSLFGSPDAAREMLTRKFGVGGPGHLLHAVQQNRALKEELKKLTRQLAGSGDGPYPPLPPAPAAIRQPPVRLRLFPLRGGLGSAAA